MERLVVYSQTSAGGAFLAARLHADALGRNFDVRFIHPKEITFKEFGILSIFYHAELLLISKANSVLRHLFYRKEFGGSFSYLSWRSLGLLWLLNRLNARIVNLHWQGAGIMGFHGSKKFKIIQTLHDEHVITGGCHYMLGCKQYRNCKSCPQTRSRLGNWIVGMRRIKAMKFGGEADFHVLSSWLKVKVHALFPKNHIIHIPNPVTSYKSNVEDKDITFVSIFSSMEPRKGANWLRSVLDNIELNSLVEIGPGTQDKPHGLGSLDHRSTLTYLARSRYIIFPSYFENLSNVIQEALSCGTRVICRPIGGNVDLIKDGVNGFFYSTKDELLTILNRLNREHKSREKAESIIDNTIDKVAEQWKSHLK